MNTPENNLAYYLKIRGMTSKQLAEQSGVPESTISRYIRGERAPSPIAQRLAIPLGSTAEVVFPVLLEDDIAERPESSDG